MDNQPSKKKGQVQEKIIVMPEEYYGQKPEFGKAHRPEQPIEPSKTKLPDKKKSIVAPIIIILLLLILILAIGWLLYVTYFQTATPTVAPATEEIEEVVEPEVLEETVEPTVEEPAAEEAEEIVYEPAEIKKQPLELMISQDTDGDKLTDDEEILFGTNVNQPDTDQDSYLDGSEVMNLYNPLAKDPAGIEYSGLVSTYVNPTYDYDLFYPKKWLARAVDQANVEVMFTSVLGEFVKVSVVENLNKQSLLTWYQQQAPQVLAQDIVEFTNKNNMTGIKSPDGFTAYFAKGRFIYIINYDIGLKTEASYPNLFNMMVESFVFTGENND